MKVSTLCIPFAFLLVISMTQAFYISTKTLGHLAGPALMIGGGYASIGAGALLYGGDSHGLHGLHGGLPHLTLNKHGHGLGLSLHVDKGHHAPIHVFPTSHLVPTHSVVAVSPHVSHLHGHHGLHGLHHF